MSWTEIILIACGILSVLAWAGTTQVVWWEWGLAPYRIKKYGEWYRLFTSIFFHADLFHILINGFVFYSFGSKMELLYGGRSYLLLLLIGVIGSGLATYWRYQDRTNHLSIGLSGVVNAVLFAFVLHYPKATLLVWFIPMPAWLFAGLYLLYSFYEGQRENGFINHWAHIGGALAGMGFAYFIK
ncbi:MAG: rhomboid family intramembrane serine protease [Bacteroidia bacterium]|nr:rhomboid family intramembrane serine protease [Bacteroidia bacterium]MDW8236594.1 rhomboid family intramembrane serine protease [Bacteroidia bacterium]